MKKVSVGHNYYPTVPVKGGTVHAEVSAGERLKGQVNNKVKKLDLIVIRTSKTGKLGSSAPCLHCLEYLQNLHGIRIKNVYYSDADGEIVCCRLKDLVNCHVTKGNH